MAKELTRREFLKATAFAGVLASTVRRGVGQSGEQINVAIIGTGDHGRTLLGYLLKIPNLDVELLKLFLDLTEREEAAFQLPEFKVAALCDIYEPHLKRALDMVGQPVPTYDDYRRVLDDKNIQAVIIATPPHTHKQIVLDALQAGKHVWCEPPLALSLDDAKAIAQAASQANTVFQVGLQKRFNPTYAHSVKFMRTGVLGKLSLAHAQWHQKTSWRKPMRDQALERQVNWKLYRETSGGLLTEVALHQFDVVRWYLGALPVSISAWGSTVLWQDGREVPDTVQCVLEFPNGVRMTYHATLTNSFQASYEIFAGEFGTIYLSGGHGVLFKEADAPSLGWEVYAKRSRLGRDEGVMLVASATKLLELGKEPSEVGFQDRLESNEFIVALIRFAMAIGNGKKVASGAIQGLESTAIALKAVEALTTGSTQTIKANELQLS
ncbi:MAG: Gfo/Idh/MocA family oxidoreductase [Armatimonadetes bacterium]|nr:Gfo/Idh/MocA family oxidoreductase [Armatimonadota bacterium]MDW8027810.1 Gfo/Idh/MocA family oxidoreductase [Armatimonadota bacterium]